MPDAQESSEDPVSPAAEESRAGGHAGPLVAHVSLHRFRGDEAEPLSFQSTVARGDQIWTGIVPGTALSQCTAIDE